MSVDVTTRGETIDGGVTIYDAIYLDGTIWKTAVDPEWPGAFYLGNNNIEWPGNFTPSLEQVFNVIYEPLTLGSYSENIEITEDHTESILVTALGDDTHGRGMERRLPTGRAWNGEIQKAYLRGIAVEFSSKEAQITGITNIDNILFGEKLPVWQNILNLTAEGTIEEQEQDVVRKLSDVGSLTKDAIETQLQAAGFDVYLHVNGLDPRPFFNFFLAHGNENAVHGRFNAVHGSILPGVTSLVVNSLDAATDESYRDVIDSDSDTWRYAFYVGGETWPARADVDASREKEFRRLLLELKPAGMWGFLLIDYV